MLRLWCPTRAVSFAVTTVLSATRRFLSVTWRATVRIGGTPFTFERMNRYGGQVVTEVRISWSAAAACASVS